MDVVSNSSPLISLTKISKIGLLPDLYNRVLIPESVYNEVIVQGKLLKKSGVDELEKGIDKGWLRPVPLKPVQLHRVAAYTSGGQIGRGEVEAILLAKSKKLTVILDDRFARELANTMDIEYFGTAAVLLSAYVKLLINKSVLLESLIELGKVSWLAPEVITKLIKLAEEAKK